MLNSVWYSHTTFLVYYLPQLYHFDINTGHTTIPHKGYQ